MTARELIDYLREQDIDIWTTGASIKIGAPLGNFCEELRGQVTALKTDVIAELQAEPARTWKPELYAWPADLRQYVNLRAVELRAVHGICFDEAQHMALVDVQMKAEELLPADLLQVYYVHLCKEGEDEQAA